MPSAVLTARWTRTLRKAARAKREVCRYRLRLREAEDPEEPGEKFRKCEFGLVASPRASGFIASSCARRFARTRPGCQSGGLCALGGILLSFRASARLLN